VRLQWDTSSATAYNLVFDHMTVLGDGAGIYTNGSTGTSLSTGEHLTGNLIHDQISSKGHGIYTDNGASYITVTGNAEYAIAADVWGSDHIVAAAGIESADAGILSWTPAI
jgi:hypothetical protein